ncbi:serine hydrolase domain-containing protein [Spongiactinospora sp. TRM90649]|uniref:serine hydrolase domain-containing protein n=1 Tax=Spongiactinospora sp. TRM90649 TaxID=3031114 RepID=UPI0023F68E3C|nr:serine hydrolase domain-containing protein [Spongiactinospora sp. TRM90649]MDF5756243.1 serine hydrolase [Spongiactinospora sp. TRM90649]
MSSPRSLAPRRLLALALAVPVLLAPVAPAFAAADRPPSVQDRLDALTTAPEIPGALAYIRHPGGRTVTIVSGTAERGAERRMPGASGRLRIASVSKSVIAATVLELADQGKVDLSKPVETYLPGVIRGKGMHGKDITVRMLLRQTSGLPDFTPVADWSKIGRQDLLKLALTLAPTPRGEFAYSNTNYLVLGKVIRAVTGRDFRVVSRDLVFKPLGMRDTYWPAKGETGIRGPHARTYGVHPLKPKDGVVDVTRLPGYEFDASGGLISTPRDLDRFWRARKPAGTEFVKIGEQGWPKGARYGYGVMSIPLSCGGDLLGHGGDLPGVSVFSGRDRAGRTATVYVTGSAEGESRQRLIAAFDTALCSR